MDNTNTSNADRKKYWDEKYRDYWMQRVAETNNAKDGVSRINWKDKLTSSDQVYLGAIDLLGITDGATILEMGCGFGRSIPFLRSVAGILHLIDISDAMIREAREKYAGDGRLCFHVCEAEKTPFDNSTFDNVVCFAVFDALYQSHALAEMNRIMKVGGRVLLTGKNNNYHDDDEEAYVAEVRAREKGHPNYFTDVAALVKNMNIFGFRIRNVRYFSRRGDFSESRFEEKMPERFYEYMFVLEKTGAVTATKCPSISDSFSETWRRKNHQL